MSPSTAKLVTVAIPVYKSLAYLPQALKSVNLQDYPQIELIVSDNGMNGSQVHDLVQQHYTKPYTFRQNPTTVPVVEHFNQLVQAASGEYFILLCDDDEISPNYVSGLVNALETHPSAAVAISHQEVIDRDSQVISTSTDRLLGLMSGPDFIHRWNLGQHGFKCFVTNLARTQDIRDLGGYPEFPRGFHSDSGLLMKLCLERDVIVSKACTFRWRVHGSSNGDTTNVQDLTLATQQFMHFLLRDSHFQAFAKAHPQRWRSLQDDLVFLEWNIYVRKWQAAVGRQLSPPEKLKAALSMPLVLGYYQRRPRQLIKEFLPGFHQLYRGVRYRGAQSQKTA